MFLEDDKMGLFFVIFVMALWQVRSAGFWKCNTSASRYFNLHFPTIDTITVYTWTFQKVPNGCASGCQSTIH